MGGMNVLGVSICVAPTHATATATTTARKNKHFWRFFSDNDYHGRLRLYDQNAVSSSETQVSCSIILWALRLFVDDS